MIKISDLPRDPDEAFQYVLPKVQEMALGFPKSNLKAQVRTEAIAYIRMLQNISRRLTNTEDYKEPLARALAATKSPNPISTSNILASVEELYLANTLDEHFIDPEDEYHFNALDWQPDDREAVLERLNEARQFTRSCESFCAQQKRKILYWLHKAETEVFKEQGKLASILSAVSQIADTASYVGEKAKPLAELVETVRTRTKKNVVEVRQISGPDNQKKLPPPADLD